MNAILRDSPHWPPRVCVARVDVVLVGALVVEDGLTDDTAAPETRALTTERKVKVESSFIARWEIG